MQPFSVRYLSCSHNMLEYFDKFLKVKLFTSVLVCFFRPSCAKVARRHTRCVQRFCQAWAHLLRAVLTAFKWCIVCSCFVVPLTLPFRRCQKKQPILAPNVGWAFFRLRRAGACCGVPGFWANFCACFCACPSSIPGLLGGCAATRGQRASCSKGCRQNGAYAHGASPVVSTT